MQLGNTCGGKMTAEELILVLEAPYPEDVFTPLTAEEMSGIAGSLKASGVQAASARLHAEWVRHWADVLRREIEKE